MPVPKGYREKKLARIKCAESSHRTVVVNKRRRILVCCPAGSWSKKTKRCKTGTKGVAMYTKK